MKRYLQHILGVVIVTAVVGLATGMLMGAIWWVETHSTYVAPVEVGAELTPTAEVAVMEPQPIVVPINIYDRSLGKVVVEVSMFGSELLVSSEILDEGEADRLMLCVAGETVRLDVVSDESTAASSPWVIESSRGPNFVCVVSDHTMTKGNRIMARLVNETGESREVLVVAGLYSGHALLIAPGRGAQNPYWDCDVRPGTVEEGMEGSVVGLWPRPIQDCTSVWREDRTSPHSYGYSACPPPCP